eukprot:4895645-Amphidinium_carterae.1
MARSFLTKAEQEELDRKAHREICTCRCTALHAHSPRMLQDRTLIPDLLMQATEGSPFRKHASALSSHVELSIVSDKEARGANQLTLSASSEAYQKHDQMLVRDLTWCQRLTSIAA